VKREFVPLAIGARVPVSFGDFNAKLDTLGTHSLAVRFRPDGRAIESIPMDSVGVMRFTHPDAQLRDLTGGASLAPEAADVVCLVSEHDGSKTITLRSLVELHNNTGDAQSGVPLRVTFRAPQGSEGEGVNAECVVRLEPGATVSVPLAAVHSGVLFVQPDLGPRRRQFGECDARDAVHMRSLDRLLGRTFMVSCPVRGVAAAVGAEGEQAPPALYLRVTPSRQVQSTSNAMRDLLRVTFAAPINVRNGLPGAVEFLVSDGALTAAAAAERDATLPPLLVGRRTIESGAVGSFFGFATRKAVNVSVRGAVLGWSDDHDPSKLVVKPAQLTLEEEKYKKSEATMELRNSVTNRTLTLQAIAVVDDEGVLCARVFAPYALIDRTRLFLSFRQSGFNDNGVMLPLTAARRDAPFLFSFPHSTLFDGKLCLKSTSAAEWSAAFSLDAVGGRANAEARGAPGERDTCVRHAIALGDGALADTKVVTFTYAYVLVNEHKRAMLDAAGAGRRRAGGGGGGQQQARDSARAGRARRVPLAARRQRAPPAAVPLRRRRLAVERHVCDRRPQRVSAARALVAERAGRAVARLVRAGARVRRRRLDRGAAVRVRRDAAAVLHRERHRRHAQLLPEGLRGAVDGAAAALARRLHVGRAERRARGGDRGAARVQGQGPRAVVCLLVQPRSAPSGRSRWAAAPRASARLCLCARSARRARCASRTTRTSCGAASTSTKWRTRVALRCARSASACRRRSWSSSPASA
jgi:hypothetical protein